MAVLTHLSYAFPFGEIACCSHVCHTVPIQLVESHQLLEFETHHVMTANPSRAEMQLKVRATIPRVVKPAGNGLGALLAPVKSSKLTVFPAALPAIGTSSM